MLQGNCLEPSPLAHPRYPWKSGQCVLTVREDFLQLETALPNFWVDQLYVRVVGNATGGHGAATLFGSHSGNLYMTRSTMVRSEHRVDLGTERGGLCACIGGPVSQGAQASADAVCRWVTASRAAPSTCARAVRCTCEVRM